MPQTLVGWLQKALNQVLVVPAGLSLRGEGDLVGVHHDVGVGVDDGALHVGEGRVPIEHLEGEDAQTPVVALGSMAITL